MRTSESIANISAALIKAQSSMSNAKKDAKNPFFKSKYADLNAVREAVLPELNLNGIAVIQAVNGETLETALVHESGEYIISTINIVVKEQGNPQAYGSALSYARRYALQAMLCVGSEDDDAESVVRNTPPVAVGKKARVTDGSDDF